MNIVKFIILEHFLVDDKVRSFCKAYMHSSEVNLESNVDQPLKSVYNKAWLELIIWKPYISGKSRGRTRTLAKSEMGFSETVFNC